MIYAFLAALLAFIAGWFAAPLTLTQQSGDCAVESLFVYDEPQRVVTTQGRWITHSNFNHHYYQARISITEDGKKPESIISHRSVDTRMKIHRSSAVLSTVKTFRISGPEASNPVWGSYIDPMAEEGFKAIIHAFRVDGGRNLFGYPGIPLTTCLPPEARSDMD